MSLDHAALCAPQLSQALLQSAPRDTYLVLLGGHSFTPPRPKQPPAGLPAWRAGTVYKPAAFAFGSYGFWAPARSLPLLITSFNGMVSSSLNSHKPLSPDGMWFALAEKRGERVYAVEPLLIGHAASFSHTWNRPRPAILARTIVWQNKSGRAEAGLRAAFKAVPSRG